MQRVLASCVRRFAAASTPTGDPWLLTPGPLTTSPTTKEAMMHDLGSRDSRFIKLNASIREQLVGLVQPQKPSDPKDKLVTVPLQGSGTFTVEATLRTLLGPDHHVLILSNGVYADRMVTICDIAKRTHTVIRNAPTEPFSAAQVHAALSEHPHVTHVASVHCETSTGILNPIQELSEVVAEHGKKYIIDAMSTFGALDIQHRNIPFQAVCSSANKCLEGVPGVGFSILNEADLLECKGYAGSLSLDLHAQHLGFEANSQWRFTPATHALVAFDQALKEHAEAGGVSARGDRYRRNFDLLTEGMAALGFETFIPAEVNAPIIVTFLQPKDKYFVFDEFYARLAKRGYVIYPGSLTDAPTFRMGCIGRLADDVIPGAVRAVEEVASELGVTSMAP